MSGEYKFTVGEYVTRDGRKAVVLCDDAPGPFPLKGWVEDAGVGSLSCAWRDCGAVWYGDKARANDLMPPAPPKPAECWVNLYQETSGRLWFGTNAYTTEDAADRAASRTPTTLLRTIRISSEDTDRYAEGWDAALGELDDALARDGYGEQGAPRKFVASLKGKANA